MDVNPLETIEQLQEDAAADRAKARLNALVAITVAVLATFMGICKVKDDNIVQAMQQAQADKLDHWNFYQARNIRQDTFEIAAAQVHLASTAASDKQQAAYVATEQRFAAKAQEQQKKKEALKADAEQDQRTYDALNVHDDQFDLSDAALAIAISMLAVTALTQKMGLFWAAMVPTGFGLLMGLAGLLSWSLHPDALTRLLS